MRPTGENYGFVVLRRGDVARQSRTSSSSTRPGPRRRAGHAAAAVPDRATRAAPRAVAPTATPPPPSARRRTTPGRRRRGRRRAALQVPPRPAGGRTSARPSSPRRTGALADPWLLGSKDENDVQGYRGHARQRQPADDRLPPRRRRGGGRLPAPEALLRLGRLAAATSSPGGSLAGPYVLQRLGRRRLAPAHRPGHDPRRGRAADARARVVDDFSRSEPASTRSRS